MNRVTLVVNETVVRAEAGQKLLDACRAAGIYVPALCAHPALPGCGGTARPALRVFRGPECIEGDSAIGWAHPPAPCPPDGRWDGCGLCVVSVDGTLVPACATEAREGMVVVTDSTDVIARRRERLSDLLATHPHACLTCAQAEGCSRTQCSANVPEDERCCELLGTCELGRVAAFIGIPATTPRYRNRGVPALTGDPLFDFRPELCIGCLRCVRACGDLRGVGTLGFVMRGGRPVVGFVGGTVERPAAVGGGSLGRSEAACRYCGACVEVCPTGALTDKTPARGAGRERTLVPCRDACPAGTDIPRLLRHVAAGEPGKAAAVIRERVPLAFTASYACFHPCEEACRRGQVNEPISVCRLKRFAVDSDARDKESAGWAGGPGPSRSSPPVRKAPTGKRVAVIGSGPAGLTAAYYLARKGHETTVFEALPEPGGMLRAGIPEYRLPREVLERDIEEVRRAGVEIRCGVTVDAARFDEIVAASDAVFVAVGAHVAKRILVPGCDLDGVHWGVDFLRERALGRLAGGGFTGGAVVVVGGGNVAVDAARVALRLGAKSVTIASLERRDELPAWRWEVEEALEEGVTLMPSWGPREVLGRDGRVVGVVLKRCLRVFDDGGRFSPEFDDGEIASLPADAVILAIGQEPSSGPFWSLGLARDGTIEHDPRTLATRAPKVWTGGDVATGPQSFIEAVEQGRRAAAAIALALGGDGVLDEVRVDRQEPAPHLGRVEGFATLARVHAPTLPGPERARGFALVEATLDAKAARAEAARCLECDLRLLIPSPPLPPRTEAVLPMTREAIESVPAVEGVFQILDADRKVLAIRGVMDLRSGLLQALEEDARARFFVHEVDPMFTRRESELIQRHLQEHGEMPGGLSELDDLF